MHDLSETLEVALIPSGTLDQFFDKLNKLIFEKFSVAEVKLSIINVLLQPIFESAEEHNIKFDSYEKKIIDFLHSSEVYLPETD